MTKYAIPLLLCGVAAAQMPGKMVTYVQAEKAVLGQDKIVPRA